jgi:hypothetical protein
MENADSTAAHLHWHRGAQLLSLVRSSFLTRWSRRLAVRFRWSAVSFDLSGSWDSVERSVLKTYLEYHVQRADYDIVAAQKSSGIKKSRLYELCKRFDVATQRPQSSIGGAPASRRPRLARGTP